MNKHGIQQLTPNYVHASSKKPSSAYTTKRPPVKTTQTSVSEHGKMVNLNTHVIRVKNDRVDITYKENQARPVIKYEHVPDLSKPGDAYILKTVAIDGLPQPKEGVLFIVNRDTVSATRKIEKSMKESEKFEEAFKIVTSNPDNWKELISLKIGGSIVRNMLKYVQRYDLRAPGEQVRDNNNRITHCKELISEFE